MNKYLSYNQESEIDDVYWYRDYRDDVGKTYRWIWTSQDGHSYSSDRLFRLKDECIRDAENNAPDDLPSLDPDHDPRVHDHYFMMKIFRCYVDHQGDVRFISSYYRQHQLPPNHWFRRTTITTDPHEPQPLGISLENEQMDMSSNEDGEDLCQID